MLRGKVKQDKERLRWLRKLLLSKDIKERRASLVKVWECPCVGNSQCRGPEVCLVQ